MVLPEVQQQVKHHSSSSESRSRTGSTSCYIYFRTYLPLVMDGKIVRMGPFIDICHPGTRDTSSCFGGSNTDNKSAFDENYAYSTIATILVTGSESAPQEPVLSPHRHPEHPLQ
jgi:hypothetical protein